MQQLRQGSELQAGKYKIEKTLGQGGFGITYLATQDLLNRKVCIKEFFFKEYCERDETTSHITLGTSSNQEFVKHFMMKFIKEARIISQLDHPNIIKIHDIFKENNTAYYVMDYIEGETLSQIVEHKGRLSEEKALEYIHYVADALKYIHDKNINHLDIKPSNIMIKNSDDTAVLIDFGLSKQYDESGSQTSSTPLGISQGYAPMEQYMAGGVGTFSPQSDIYALGATLYKLITGDTPPSATEILNNGLPSITVPISGYTFNTISKALQPKKSDRPQSIDEFCTMLKGTDTVQQEVIDHQKKTEESSSNETSKEDETILIKQKIAEPIKANVEKDFPQHKVVKEADEKKSNQSSIRLKTVFFIIAIFVLLFYVAKSSKSPEDLYREGRTLYEKELYVDAIPLIQESAEKGYADAQCHLGYCYENGQGISKDEQKAVEWYKKAAEQGNPYAQYNLGNCYEYGQGVSKDEQKATEWYKKAAEQGNAEAQYNLGYSYDYGKGTLINKELAVFWYRKSAEQGYEKAQLLLGICYRHNVGGLKNINESFKWFKESAEKGNASAQWNLGDCYKLAIGTEKDDQLAFGWYKKSADKGNAIGQARLGYCYESGTGVPKDEQKAVEWYKKAAEQGNPYAQYNLGMCYEFGKGMAKDEQKAIEWYKKALKGGVSAAKNNISRIENKSKETYTRRRPLI